MRRFAFIALAFVSAACGVQEINAGEQSLSFVSPATIDVLLTRTETTLGELGFTVGGRHENLVFTAPQPLPEAARGGPGSPADTAGAGPQLWFVHVVANNRLFRGGSNVTVRGYLVPRTGNLTPGNILQQQAQPVTSARPAAYRELRRIADRLHAVSAR